MGNCFLTKLLRQFNEERIVFSTNGTRTVGYPHKTEKFRFLPHNIHRINLKWTMHLNVNIGENLHDPELGK